MHKKELSEIDTATTEDIMKAIQQLQGDINVIATDFAELQAHLTSTIWRAASLAVFVAVAVVALVIVLN